jgi:hypothetical protein
LQVLDSHGDVVRTVTSTLPPPIEGEAYPRYWLATPESLALSTNVGLNRFTWDLQYDDPPAFRHDLENQMNMVAGSTTPGPHGPQVIPGVYTLKLTVDGKAYTRKVTVRNDPRVGQSPAIMAALQTQNRLTLLAYHGMQQAYQAHDEVAAVETQLASLMKTSLPGDVDTQAKKLQADLNKIVGVVQTGFGGGGGFGRQAPDPNAMRSFVTLNEDYNTLVSMMQVGMDMAPTKTQIATWEKSCSKYNETVTAWAAAKKQIGEFNTVLAKNHLQELSVPSSKVSDPPCTFSAGSTPASTKTEPKKK